jgi:7-cyano-7-deazaguanine synthase in queuosine biosynthesis
MDTQITNKAYADLFSSDEYLYGKEFLGGINPIAKKEWIHEFEGLNVILNPEWNNIAVNLSGGADSAILTFILASIIKNNNYNIKIHIISHVRVWQKRPWAGFISKDVYDYLKKMFPEIIGDRIVSYIPPELEDASAGPLDGKSGDRIIIYSFNLYCSYAYNLNIVYNATTLNPIETEIDKSPPDRSIAYYNEKFNNKLWQALMPKGSKQLMPFRLVEKDFIIHCYLKYNLVDLLNITRSCEGDSTYQPELFTDYTKYIHGETNLPECGVCFWCNERKWAIKKVYETFQR